MGHFVYSMNVSLDLRIEQVPADNGVGEWLRIDEELLLCTHPAILGFGRPLSDEYVAQIEVDLLEQRSFEQGVTMHRYAIRDVSEASPC
jgi:hypothetical protein